MEDTSMVRLNSRISASDLRFVSVALFAIWFVATSAVPAFAQGSGTWTTTGSLNTARTAHTATLLQNGQVLATGGQDTSKNILTSAELYNLATGKWTFTGSTATPRLDHTATLLANGEVLVAGGYLGVDAHYQPLYTATAELYNPSTGTWKATGSMTVPRAFHGATLLPSGQVLVAGGSNADGSSNFSAELYDPSTGTWKSTGSMSYSHASPLTLLQDGQVLVANETAELYDPATKQWTKTSAMYYTFGTSRLAAVLLTNGDALVYGNHFACYASEFYNPTANIWSRTNGQCGTGVSYGPLALLGTGKVLLAGGVIIYSGKSYPSAHSSLYDPSTNTWLSTGSLKQGGSHTLTLLQNGQALAVGGTDAELYTP
jgi:N-acetylneuraminic acid mutarotase